MSMNRGRGNEVRHQSSLRSTNRCAPLVKRPFHAGGQPAVSLVRAGLLIAWLQLNVSGFCSVLARGGHARRARELRITSVFPCVAGEFKARVPLRFIACGWRWPLAVDGGSGTPRGHGVMPVVAWLPRFQPSPPRSRGTRRRPRACRCGRTYRRCIPDRAPGRPPPHAVH